MPLRTVDIPTRPGVTERVLVLAPQGAKAAVALLPGGHGGLEITRDGAIRSLKGNFLVRSRELFADRGLIVAVIDAPSDHQSPPFLAGFRQTPEHAADLRAVIAWLRENYKVPAWLIGTSRGTQSVAYVATELTGHDGPDGIVLSSSYGQSLHASCSWCVQGRRHRAGERRGGADRGLGARQVVGHPTQADYGPT